ATNSGGHSGDQQEQLQAFNTRPTVEVTGHKAHGAVPEPGSVVIARADKLVEELGVKADYATRSSPSPRPNRYLIPA
ncbi:unnamed protein product, partial [Ilex paraguariensis]